MRIIFSLVFLGWTAATVHSQQLLQVKVDGKWGLINADRKMVVQPRYDAIGEFSHSGYAIMLYRGGVGLLGRDGREVLPPNYRDIRVLDEALVEVLSGDTWRLVSLPTQEVLLDGGYERVRLLTEHLLAYKQNKQWGVITRQGALVRSPAFTSITTDQYGFLRTTSGNAIGLLDHMGKEVLSPVSEDIRFVSPLLAFFQRDGRWGVVDLIRREVLLGAEFESCRMISDQFVQLTWRGRDILYGLSCKQLIKDKSYDAFLPFSREMALAVKGNHVGLINACGQQVLPIEYEEVLPFADQVFRVKMNGQWGLVDQQNRQILTPGFDYISPLRGDLARVRAGTHYGLVHAGGKLLLPTVYEEISFNSKDALSAILSKDGATIYETYRLLDNDRLEKQLELPNHFQLKVKGKVDARDESRHLFQLDHYEWYFDAEAKGWGLRSLQDGHIQIKPTFKKVLKPMAGLSFSLVGVEADTRLTFHKTAYRFGHRFGLVNNDSGFVMTRMEFLDVKMEDFRRGLPVARCFFVDGSFGLVNRAGRILVRGVSYIGAFRDGMARYGMYGALSGDLDNPGGLGFLRDFLGELQTWASPVNYTVYDREFHRTAQLVCASCQWGYMDTTGQVHVPAKYEFARPYVKDLAMVKLNGRWGMVNGQGKKLLDFKYDQIEFLENADRRVVRVYVEQPRMGMIDTTGRMAVHTRYDDLGSFSEGMLSVKQAHKWGYVNRDGEVVIACRYDEAHSFNEGLAAAKMGNKWGFINLDGIWQIEPTYSRVGPFSEDLAWAVRAGRTGYLDRRGQWVIEPVFEAAGNFDRGVAIIKQDNRYGLIDKTGKIFVQPQYVAISHFDRHGLAVAVAEGEGSRHMLIDLNGQTLASGYDKIHPFHEGLAVIRDKGQFGYMDTLGKVVIDPQYSKAGPMSQGRAAVQLHGDCGYIDRQGTEVVKFEFSRCKDFEDGIAVVYRGIRKAGLVDEFGHPIVEPSINQLLEFSDGRGLVRGADYRFYYITDQAVLHNGFYQEASPFEYGVAVVRENGKWGIINQQGIEIIPPRYEKIHGFENGFAKVQVTGFNGLVNDKGELIIDPKYEYISYAGEGIFRVEQGDQVGYFDLEGNWIWELD